MASKWTESGYNCYQRKVGPFTVNLYGSLSRDAERMEYTLQLGAHEEKFTSDGLGVAWHSDSCARAACREANKRIKLLFKSWAKEV